MYINAFIITLQVQFDDNITNEDKLSVKEFMNDKILVMEHN